MIEGAAVLLIIIAAFAFGFYTGRDRARDEAAFDKARASIVPDRFND